MSRRFLSRDEIRIFYNRFGIKQDWQRFYEGPALRDLLKNGRFESAGSVFELGCGTGAFARTLLTDYLPPGATYLGVDISSTMVALARERLARFKGRAEVRLTDGSLRFERPEESFDRFVSNYVLDLLPPDDIGEALREAHRLVRPKGRLCVMSLTRGQTWPSRLLTGAWDRLHRLRPGWVGGCRPVELLEFVRGDLWWIDYQNVVTAFGISSEVVIAMKR